MKSTPPPSDSRAALARPSAMSTPPDERPRFSACIPNYNYARYIGETISSVLTQGNMSLEIRVSDNASTDDSATVVESFGDPRICLSVNPVNLGFSPNLDLAAHRATGDIMFVLSSDDLVLPNALATYDTIFAAHPDQTTIVTSFMDKIDGQGNPLGILRTDHSLWAGATMEVSLSEQVGYRVMSIDPGRLLRQSLSSMKNPFNFSATAYSRELYHAVGGYLGSRQFGPDKWFHWRIAAKADRILAVEAPLFGYRWHDENQSSIQSSQGSLKFLVDDYLNTLEITPPMLELAGLSRADVEMAFIEFDIGRHGLATLARGDRLRARRIGAFGRATYPMVARRNTKVIALSAAARLGPLGELAGRTALRYRKDGTAA